MSISTLILLFQIMQPGSTKQLVGLPELCSQVNNKLSSFFLPGLVHARVGLTGSDLCCERYNKISLLVINLKNKNDSLQ